MDQLHKVLSLKLLCVQATTRPVGCQFAKTAITASDKQNNRHTMHVTLYSTCCQTGNQCN